LAIDEALGLKEGMAKAYGNLGNAYRTRGDLGQTEAMYKKALALFAEVGASAQAQQVQQLLEALNKQ
jgi:tetratricopeptide (TPR) repeat protein